MPYVVCKVSVKNCYVREAELNNKIYVINEIKEVFGPNYNIHPQLMNLWEIGPWPLNDNSFPSHLSMLLHKYYEEMKTKV